MCMQIFMKDLGEGINCYKSLPKHKTIIKDLDNIIQDFKTARLGVLQNRYTALTSMRAQRRSWFISAAEARSVTEIPIHCSCSALSVCFPFAWWKIYLRIRITNGHCLQNNINLSMKINCCKRRFLTLLFARAPPPWPVIKSIKYINTTNGRISLLKQIQVWTTDLFHSEINIYI